MYAITYEGKSFGPDGLIKDVEGNVLEAEDAEAFNRELERQEIEHIKSGPDKLTLYVGKKPESERQDICRMVQSYYCVTTWPGTWLGWAWLGPRRNIGFGYHTYRRAITVRIFGTLYHGWYMESSGDYCRLKKAKNQNEKYVATRV